MKSGGEIPVGRAIGHLKAVATPSRAGTRVVNARLGVHQQWMGLDEAISIVRLAKRCFLDDSGLFALTVPYAGETYSFQIDPKETV